MTGLREAILDVLIDPPSPTRLAKMVAHARTSSDSFTSEELELMTRNAYDACWLEAEAEGY